MNLWVLFIELNFISIVFLHFIMTSEYADGNNFFLHLSKEAEVIFISRKIFQEFTRKMKKIKSFKL